MLSGSKAGGGRGVWGGQTNKKTLKNNNTYTKTKQTHPPQQQNNNKKTKNPKMLKLGVTLLKTKSTQSV